jgi:CorA-like Mg2+ transporter protein
MHLEDCRVCAYKGVTHGLQVLDRVTKWVDLQNTPRPLWDAGEPFPNRLAALQGDLRYFRNEFTGIAAEIEELQKILREYLQLSQNRRNLIITCVAAFYLPLSFTTSFFGMNLRPTTRASPQGFSNWTASWIENLPVETRNSTQALVSTIGSSGNLTHSWTTFAITIACLFFTFPLVLHFGAIGMTFLATRHSRYPTRIKILYCVVGIVTVAIAHGIAG